MAQPINPNRINNFFRKKLHENMSYCNPLKATVILIFHRSVSKT